MHWQHVNLVLCRNPYNCIRTTEHLKYSDAAEGRARDSRGILMRHIIIGSAYILSYVFVQTWLAGPRDTEGSTFIEGRIEILNRNSVLYPEELPSRRCRFWLHLRKRAVLQLEFADDAFDLTNPRSDVALSIRLSTVYMRTSLIYEFA